MAALTTIMPNGFPQTSVVWCDFDSEFVRVNTMRGFGNERNMRLDNAMSTTLTDGRVLVAGDLNPAAPREQGN